jgi:hypothetical protein
MADVPVCANFLNRACEMSNTYVEKEGDSYYTIRCRTCRGINIFPKDRDENHSRYNAFLSRRAEEAKRLREWESLPKWSIPGTRPGEKL